MTPKKGERKKSRESVGASREELNRLNRILRVLYECNHALVHAAAETELYQSICQILVDVGGLRLAWVGHCEQDAEKTVKPVAIAGYRPDYVQNAKISWSEETERGRGPTGVALRTGKPCWVKDVKVDPMLAPWRTEANARGYASCVALPLIAEGKRLGCLSLYAAKRNAFNESTIDQYTDLANNLAFGVAALRTREERERAVEALRDSEQRLQDIVDNTTAVIFVKDLDLRYLLINREYERRHGVKRNQVCGKTDFDIHPNDVAEAVRANDRQVIAADAPIQFEEAVPSGQGERYYVSSKFLLRDRAGMPYAVCGIATDITQLKQAEAMQRRRARQAAMRADIQTAFSDENQGELQIVLQRSAEAVVRHLDAAFARIWILNEQENVLELRASAGQYTHLDGEHSRIPVGKFKIGLIALERKAHLTNDVMNNERISHPDWAKREKMQAFAGHPLIVEGRLVGVLGMFARHRLEPDTLDALESAADLIAQGVDRKVAAEKFHQNAAKLSRANEVLRQSLDALARDKKFQSFVDQVLAALTDQLGGHSSTLWLIDVKRRAAHLHSLCQDGRVVVAENSDHPNARTPRFWSNNDPEWIALQMKRPFIHSNPVHDPNLRYTPSQRARLSALGIEALLLIPLVFGDELIGVLSVRMAGGRQIDEEALEFAKSLAQQATLALELARLARVARQTAVLEERNQMAGEIHDSLAQFFAGISFQLGAARKVMKSGGHTAPAYLERAIELAEFGLAEARRSAFSLQPTIIEELGLTNALRKLVQRSNIAGRVCCDFHSAEIPEEKLELRIKEDLLKIAQEAISNSVRHAKPTNISVSLQCDPQKLLLEIADDGSGIDDPQQAYKEGFGLSNMRARAERVGAQFEVRSTQSRGTAIVVRLPWNG